MNYTSYCKKCNKNVCMFCVNEHKEHEITNYVNIIQNINDNNKLRNDINKFKEKINNIRDRLNKVKDIIEYYYNINKKLYDCINNNHINYELLYTYNKINKSDIMNDINYIINNNNYEKLNEIYNKINTKFNDEITIQYIIKENQKEIKLLGKDFVKNNKDNCKIIILGNEMELKEIIELNNITNNILEIKLKGISNVNDMSGMFFNCSSLNSLPDISKWNTSKVNNMSRMFYNCYSLNSLPDISKWNTSNVHDMSKMFYKCSKLSKIPPKFNK